MKAEARPAFRIGYPNGGRACGKRRGGRKKIKTSEQDELKFATGREFVTLLATAEAVQFVPGRA